MTDAIEPAGSLYARHARAADRAAWSVERDVRWAEIDRAQALAQPDILAKLRSAALIESFHPVNLSRLIRFAWDDIDAGVVFSLEMYEGFKHFHALRMYLDAVGYEPRITDEELCRIPVVVLTTSAADEDILRSYQLHANAYVTKPVDFDRFIAVIRQIDEFFVSVVKLPPRA